MKELRVHNNQAYIILRKFPTIKFEDGNVLNKNKNYGAQSRKEADLIAKANKAALNFTKSKSSKDKQALNNIKKQVDAQVNLSEAASTQLKTLFKSTEEFKKQLTSG